jgi:outer membrane protein assembly factor BamB
MTRVVRALLGAAVLAALASACAWPQPGDAMDPRPSGRVGRPVLELAWRRTLHDRREDHRPQEFAGVAPAARAGDLVLAGSLGGDFYALEAERGEVRWKRKLGPVSSMPLVVDDVVYVGTDDGALVALHLADGGQKWRYATKGAVLHTPVVHGDLLVFSNDSDRVFAIERETGKWRWQYERETPDEFTVRGHGGVTIAGEVVYAGFADGNVVALNAATGDVLWVRSLAGDKTQFIDVDTTPVVSDGVLFAASASGGVYALDISNGTEKWRAPISGASDITLDDGHLYVAAAETGLYALDRAGHVLWRQGLAKAGDPARPVIDRNYLLLSTATAGLFVVDKRTGQLFESWNPGDGITSEPTIVGDRLYVLSNGGVLYAMNLARY